MQTKLETAPFEGVNATTGYPLQLAMQALWLTGRVLPVGAELRVRHLFRSGEPRPAEVIYTFALPRDGALHRFRMGGEGFSVKSDLRKTEEAESLYEQALSEGRLTGLARQYRDGLVNLAVGNLQPGETVWVELDLLAGLDLREDGWRFRFPFTLAPLYHWKARAIESRQGLGELELPRSLAGLFFRRGCKTPGTSTGLASICVWPCPRP